MFIFIFMYEQHIIQVLNDIREVENSILAGFRFEYVSYK